TGSPTFCVHSTVSFVGSMPTTVPYPLVGERRPLSSARPPPKPSARFSFFGVTLVDQARAPPPAEKADTVPTASRVNTLPTATIGPALRRPLDEEPVPMSPRHALFKRSPRARWPRLLEGLPPGSAHDALATGGGKVMGFPAAAGSGASRL